MGNKRVFIGWNGADNREIAHKISNILSEANYHPIIGGQWRASLTVSEEIIHQMNGCDFAIILIEKEIRKNDRDEIVSMGFNPNVMMEMGYMLHKLTDPNRIRRILINMDPSELPSDLQGAWSIAVKKPIYAEGDENARDAALSHVASKATEDFFEYIKIVRSRTNKLDYFDHWDENVLDIYRYTGDVRISEKLIFGMQAAIYSGDFEKLYQKLLQLRDQLSQQDRFHDYPAVACAIAVLSVFVVSKRLTVLPTEQQFYDLCEALEQEYERDVDDPGLQVWCKIFRLDKQELCYELFAQTLEDDSEKIEYFYDALSLCHEIVDLIEAHLQTEEGKKDEKYALLYKAFAHRNISQIHKRLCELEPEKATEHLEEQKKYCAVTLRNRKELYDYYNGSARENTLSMDFISQEYLLALAEQHKFEENRLEKRKIAQTVRGIFHRWQDRNTVRNMIFEKVGREAAEFLTRS